MPTRNSQIIIASGINLDNSYKNVLSYNEQAMLNLVNSKKITSRNNYSFIRGERESILVDVAYGDLVYANYIAFQNPNYSNKWFFAFIEDINYKSNSATEIFFTIDVWSTWFSNWTPARCFVIREHTNDDTIGANTLPEPLETGEFVVNSHIIDEEMDDVVSDLVYVMSSTVDIYDGDGTSSDDFKRVFGGLYNGIYSGTKYYLIEASGIEPKLRDVAKAGKLDFINGLFMAPRVLARIPSELSPAIAESDTSVDYSIYIAKQSTINGYTPKNNKLLTGQFNYLLVSNNNGASSVYEYENFSGDDANFKVQMALTPGCSIRMIPINYRGTHYGDEYGLNMGKFPICSYACDMYTNWLTQNSINIAGANVSSDDINIASAGLSATLGIVNSLAFGDLTGTISGIANAGVSISNSLIAKKQHSLIPTQVRGNLNCGDVITSSNKNNFHFYKMSIKEQYARCIDEYFTRFGYLTNRDKIPNIYGRTTFNYVQIDSSSCIGYGNVPKKYMEIINNIARGGVTIWHNHEYINNFDGENNIISE
ncbi:MAG: hypothetical protein MJ224_01670 [archaeon]|nr:hypothetical protein [archaeon]